jgi:hypothetical protein
MANSSTLEDLMQSWHFARFAALLKTNARTLALRPARSEFSALFRVGVDALDLR